MPILNRNQRRVLSEIVAGRSTLERVRDKEMSQQAVMRTVEQLIEMGLAQRMRGPGRPRWSATPAGVTEINGSCGYQDRTTLQPPPAPPRRPGADDWQRLPSMAAGRLR